MTNRYQFRPNGQTSDLDSVKRGAASADDRYETSAGSTASKLLCQRSHDNGTSKKRRTI